MGLPECATPPEEVYELAKRRGMDFVTITDHDTISGALQIDHLPDAFTSVELTARFRGEPQAVHVLCFGISPDDHARLQERAGDVEACAAYLAEQGLACSLAHPFQAVGAPLTPRHLRRLGELFPVWETVNGSRVHELNHPAAVWADALDSSTTGGSDDHAGVDVGRTYTEAPPATTPDEFLAHVREGRARGSGEEGGIAKWAHAALALAVRTVDLDRTTSVDPLRIVAIAQALADRGQEDVDGIEPADAASLLRAWIEAVGLDATDARSLLERLQEDGFRHEDLERRATRTHERALARAVGSALGEEITRGRYGAAAARLFEACLPAVPYLPPAAIVARDRAGVRPRRTRPRVGVVVEAIGGIHGVTRSMEQIRERGVPGFEVEVVGTDPNVDRRLPAVAEVEIPFYPGLSLGIPSVHAVVEALSDGRYDLLHLTSPGPAVIAAAAVGRLTDTPLVFSYDTELAAYAGLRSGDASFEQRFASVLGAVYSLGRVVLSSSAAADASLARLGVPPDRIARWDRGVDVSRFAPERATRGFLAGEVTLLYAGRLTVEKGIDLLADAFLAARALDPRLHLYLAGGGPEETWLRGRLGEHASFLGWLDQDELARIYPRADIFVFPSATDTFGQVVLEAQASGLPVVAVNEGGPTELVLDGVTGLVCAPEPRALAQAIAALAGDPQLRLRLGAAGWAAVQERTWDRALGRLAEGYARALAERDASRLAA